MDIVHANTNFCQPYFINRDKEYQSSNQPLLYEMRYVGRMRNILITLTNTFDAIFHFRKNTPIFLMFIVILSISSALIFSPKLVYGHAFVTRSDPAPSQSLPTSPSKVDVFFSEPVDVKYSKLKVLDQDGKQINPNKIHYLNGDQSALTSTLTQLKDGVYTVSTTVLSQTDGHVTDNAFIFAVGDAVVPSNITQPNSQESNLYIPEALARFPTLVGQVIIVGGAFSALWLWGPIYNCRSTLFVL